MKIVKSNGQYTFYNKIEIIDKLEVKNYVIKHFMGSIYLEEASEFVLPKKLYDVEKGFRDIVLKSFNLSDRNTGVLLEGYKGQGKTITSKLLCLESKLPVIMIDSRMPSGLDLIGFLNGIQQEFVLFIDEFEKIFKSSVQRYNSETDTEEKVNDGYHTQNMFLTLTDGALSNEFKKLFVFTTNDKVDEHFMNRPSRIKWHKTYKFMDSKLFKMIIDDKLKYKEFKDDLLKNLPIQECTVDLLTTVIDQINLLKIPYGEFKEFFNHTASNIKYKLEFVENNGKVNKFSSIGEITLSSEPIIQTRYIEDLTIKKIESISDKGLIFSSKSFHQKLPEKYAKEYQKYKEGFIYKITKVEDFTTKYAF